MAARLQIEGVEAFQRMLDDLPIKDDRGRRRLTYDALRKVRTPIRRQIRANIPRGRLKRSIRVTLGSRRRPFFRVRGRNYLVPYNAESGAVTRELDKLPDEAVKAVLELYDQWLRRHT